MRSHHSHLSASGTLPLRVMPEVHCPWGACPHGDPLPRTTQLACATCYLVPSSLLPVFLWSPRPPHKTVLAMPALCLASHVLIQAACLLGRSPCALGLSDVWSDFCCWVLVLQSMGHLASGGRLLCGALLRELGPSGLLGHSGRPCPMAGKQPARLLVVAAQCLGAPSPSQGSRGGHLGRGTGTEVACLVASVVTWHWPHPSGLIAVQALAKAPPSVALATRGFVCGS